MNKIIIIFISLLYCLISFNVIAASSPVIDTAQAQVLHGPIVCYESSAKKLNSKAWKLSLNNSNECSGDPKVTMCGCAQLKNSHDSETYKADNKRIIDNLKSTVQEWMKTANKHSLSVY